MLHSSRRSAQCRGLFPMLAGPRAARDERFFRRMLESTPCARADAPPCARNYVPGPGLQCKELLGSGITLGRACTPRQANRDRPGKRDRSRMGRTGRIVPFLPAFGKPCGRIRKSRRGTHKSFGKKEDRSSTSVQEAVLRSVSLGILLSQVKIPTNVGVEYTEIINAVS